MGFLKAKNEKEMLLRLTKQSQFEYSTALDCKGEVRAVEDGDEVIIYKKKKRADDSLYRKLSLLNKIC